jgi:hypothetical protein
MPASCQWLTDGFGSDLTDSATPPSNDGYLRAPSIQLGTKRLIATTSAQAKGLPFESRMRLEQDESPHPGFRGVSVAIAATPPAPHFAKAKQSL